MPYGFSFSLRRAIGASAASARISRAIGVPLTRSGRERTVGRAVMSWCGAGVVLVILLVLAHL
jgi:hypothetical protein